MARTESAAGIRSGTAPRQCGFANSHAGHASMTSTAAAHAGRLTEGHRIRRAAWVAALTTCAPVSSVAALTDWDARPAVRMMRKNPGTATAIVPAAARSMMCAAASPAPLAARTIPHPALVMPFNVATPAALQARPATSSSGTNHSTRRASQPRHTVHGGRATPRRAPSTVLAPAALATGTAPVAPAVRRNALVHEATPRRLAAPVGAVASSVIETLTTEL